MGLDPQQLKQHCRYILQQSRIKGKIVVLCEGDIRMTEGRLSPQTYGRMERWPDANFYKACVPQWWRQQKPEFVTCGDRNGVIDTYFTLPTLHAEDPSNSFLSPDRLFAIVDLDLQQCPIKHDYPFQTTEAIFQDLYAQGCVQPEQATQHRIWTTGLIHKEAYFLVPALQGELSATSYESVYDGKPVLLRDLYFDMADAMPDCQEVCENLDTIRSRLTHCLELDCSTPDTLSRSWRHQFQTASDDAQRHRLTIALLSINPAKPFWKKIEPPEKDTRSPQQFRDQLSRTIGQFYSCQDDDQLYHLVAFFQVLSQYLP